MQLREINLGPGQKIDAANASATCGRGLRLGGRRPAFAEGFDILAQNAPMIA